MSVYNCYTCQAKGALKSMLWRLQSLNGNTYKHLYPYVKNDGDPTADKILEKIKGASMYQTPEEVAGVVVPAALARRKKAQEPEPLPESTLDGFRELSAAAIDYLTGPKRKLSWETIKAFDLGWDERTRRIVIPIRDCQNRLVGYSRRSIEDLTIRPGKKKPAPKFLHSVGFRRDFYLFGENLFAGSRVGYLIEGFFDSMWLYQLGYRGAGALMGTYTSEMQEEKIVKFFDKVFILGDGDAAGREMGRKTSERLKGRVATQIAELPEGRDPDELWLSDLEPLIGPPG